MNDLIFLPIEIDIISTSYFVDKQASNTFHCLWSTKKLTESDIDESKHKELIETNLKKYQDLAVFSQ